jgi:CRP/FNR family transcriptional regulator, cyclic AMP receptor protein
MTIADIISHISLADVIGYVGNVVVIVTYSMRTMIPLRTLGMCSNAVFLVYSALLGLYPLMILQCILLPLNGYRLWQMMRLTKQVQAAAEGDGSMDWLKPFMSKRNCKAGELLFHKGAMADEMFFTVSGKFRLVESGIEIGTGQVVGELGLLAPDQHRTQSLRCEESGELLSIEYSEVKQLYYQNPEFGFYFLRLATGRLFENLRDMEGKLAAREELPEEEVVPDIA